jgi:hypothetical protein
LYSVSSALGIAISDRSVLTGGRETLRASYADVVAEIETIEKKLAGLTKHRSAREVEAAISAALMEPVTRGTRLLGTVGVLSADCTRVETRTAELCADIAVLRQELAAAIEGQRLEKRLGELRSQVQSLRERGATLSSDAQAELFARLTRGWLSVADVGPGLALLLALVIELVSAFGPAVLAGYADATRTTKSEEDAPSRLVAAGRGVPQQVALHRDEGEVVSEYMAERIAPAGETQAIGGDEIFADYLAWCRQKKYAAMEQREFLAAFDRKRQEYKLEGKIRKFGKRYFGVRLAEAVAS